MALKVIGAGYPRTGTSSLKAALVQLGFGPCYHMDQLMHRPGDWPHWLQACAGGPVAWDELLADYVSSTDIPGCNFYAALANRWPDARIILTVRDADSWFDSTQATVLAPAMAGHFADNGLAFDRLMHALGWHPEDADTHDRQKMTERFTAHNENVRRAIPPDRLLVFEAREGWGPLCRFLDVVVPDGPFPHVNSTNDFLALVGGMESG